LGAGVELPLGAAEPTSADPLAGAGTLRLVKGGFVKADTPAWIPGGKFLLLTDLDRKRVFRLDPPDAISEVLDKAARGTTGPDGRYYAAHDGSLVSWLPGETPQAILDKSPTGRELSLNDVAVSAKGFLYFTTLKDPDKGRLTVVNIEKKTAAVAFDGENEPNLWNPNGVALSPDGRHLYVGVSAYKNRKASGVYRFALGEDGMPDVAEGKKKPWAAAAGPDGIAVDRDGNVYVTVGGAVLVFAPDGTKRGSLKIPKGSGTNLAFGDPDMKTLYVTTNEALYSVRVGVPGTLP
jgi:gluconolactonase